PSGNVSTADVSVTWTWPPLWPTANGTKADCNAPPAGGGTVPVRMSVAIVGVGVVGVGPFEPPAQPETTTASAGRSDGRTKAEGGMGFSGERGSNRGAAPARV